MGSPITLFQTGLRVPHAASYHGGEKKNSAGCIGAFQSERGEDEKDDCYLTSDKDTAESFRGVFSPLSSKRSPQNLSGGASRAFLNLAGWLEAHAKRRHLTGSRPLCLPSTARPDLTLERRTIAWEGREGAREGVEQWPYVGLFAAAGGSIGEYFIRAWAKFFPNENIHISPKVRPHHMGMFINTAALALWMSAIIFLFSDLIAGGYYCRLIVANRSQATAVSSCILFIYLSC